MFGAMDAAPIASNTPLPVAPRWQWSRLPQLSTADLYVVLAARQQVFAVEQHCAFQDADGYDVDAWHLLGWSGGGTAPTLAAYLRVLDPGTKYAEPSVGRVLTLPPFRGSGLGRAVMMEGIARCAIIWPGRPIRIAAQQRLEAFYASLAFRRTSPSYIEDGIPHVDMMREAA